MKFMGPQIANFRYLRPQYSRIKHECFEKAVENNHPLFGVEYWGECYTSVELDLSVQTRLNDPNCDKDGMGGFDKVSVFRILQ